MLALTCLAVHQVVDRLYGTCLSSQSCLLHAQTLTLSSGLSIETYYTVSAHPVSSIHNAEWHFDHCLTNR